MSTDRIMRNRLDMGRCGRCNEYRHPASRFFCVTHLDQQRAKYTRRTTGKRGRPAFAR